MADYRQLVPIIKGWEGGYVNDPVDSGGATNKGVTLATFRTWFGRDKTAADLARITDEQWIYIFLNGYWNRMLADGIKSQPVANILVDWAWASGPATAAKQVQKIVGTTADGIVGSKTLAAINASDPRSLFDKIKAARLAFVENLAKKRPKDQKYLKGWKARINSFTYGGGTSGAALAVLAGIAVVFLILTRNG